MSDYIKKFQTVAAYNAAKSLMPKPNVVFIEEGNKIVYTNPKANQNFVDLGLPSGKLWCDRNLGASAPEDAGLYFMWGDIVGHTASESFNFDWGNGWDSTNKEFDPSSNYGQCSGAQITTDIPNDPRYDAAANMIGGGAHIPTRGDCYELETFCTRTWKAINGMNGWEFTGPNGNKIFFPAASYFDGSEIGNVGSGGYYWESTLYNVDEGCYLYFDSSDVNPGNDSDRYCGYSVRAVQ
jgi:hypothetical protein